MPMFRVTVADEAGHALYDERIEAPGPMEACSIAVRDAGTAEAADVGDFGEPVHVPGAMAESGVAETSGGNAVPTAADIGDVINVTRRLEADLATARAANDPEIVHASIIAAVEGLLQCVRTLASEVVKVEIEGVDTHLPAA